MTTGNSVKLDIGSNPSFEVTIVIKDKNGKSIALSVDEARGLYNDLDKIFRGPTFQVPYVPPTFPTTPFGPGPGITWAVGTGGPMPPMPSSFSEVTATSVNQSFAVGDLVSFQPRTVWAGGVPGFVHELGPKTETND